jgi:hypothetical protein
MSQARRIRTRQTVGAILLLLGFVMILSCGAVLADDRAKQVAITGIGFLYYQNSGALAEVHFSVSHRLPQPIVSLTFAMAFRSPNGTVLKTARYRHPFRSEAKPGGSALVRDDVYQVQYPVYPDVQGFCNGSGTCGTVQVRVIEVETE